MPLQSFPSNNPFLLRDMRVSAKRGSVTACGELFVPHSGNGPYPAAVVLQGLGGPKDVRERAYGAMLAEQGYGALVVDVFGSRGHRNSPEWVRALAVTEAMYCADAFAALRFLKKHPAVDPQRVYAIGFSYGGMASVLVAYEQIARLFAHGEERFAGHASYYGCSIPRLQRVATTGAPVLMMLGGRDDNVSVSRSQAIAEDLRRGGSDVAFKVFEEAYHQWDGGDETLRRVRPSLKRCAVAIDPDAEMIDEASGERITGALTRTARLILRSDLRGYGTLRDEEAMQHSDEMLLDFLGAEHRSEVSPQAAADRHVEATRDETC